MVAYRDFVDRMNYEQEKYKMIDLVFKSFSAAM